MKLISAHLIEMLINRSNKEINIPFGYWGDSKHNFNGKRNAQQTSHLHTP